MKLTSALDYGIRALIYLARQPGGKVCFISEISSAMNIPEKYLAKILQSLSKGGMVKSYRGVKGGFSLAKPPEELSIKDAFECLEGPITLRRCIDEPGICDMNESCNVRPVWQDAQDRMLEVFEKADLKSLAFKGDNA
jgi:Rrf2 family protein